MNTGNVVPNDVMSSVSMKKHEGVTIRVIGCVLSTRNFRHNNFISASILKILDKDEY